MQKPEPLLPTDLDEQDHKPSTLAHTKDHKDTQYYSTISSHNKAGKQAYATYPQTKELHSTQTTTMSTPQFSSRDQPQHPNNTAPEQIDKPQQRTKTTTTMRRHTQTTSHGTAETSNNQLSPTSTDSSRKSRRRGKPWQPTKQKPQTYQLHHKLPHRQQHSSHAQEVVE
jgi:hypothetical protein